MPINNVIYGDIIKECERGVFNVMVQGCNCHCIQGSGLAGQLRKYPQVLQADREFYSRRTARDKLGQFSVADIQLAHHTFHVFNMYTQLAPATTLQHKSKERVADYNAIDIAFHKLNTFLKDTNFKIAIPQIGAGLAYGDWDVIETIINKATPNLDITLVMYKP